MGGFFAVVWTDVFQGMLIIGILVLLPVAGVIKLGGFNVILMKIGEININTLSPSFGYTGLFFILFAFASMAWFFGYPGQPHILARYMAIKDEEKLWSSTAIGMT